MEQRGPSRSLRGKRRQPGAAPTLVEKKRALVQKSQPWEKQMRSCTHDWPLVAIAGLSFYIHKAKPLAGRMPFLPIELDHPEISLAMWHVEETEAYFRDRLNIYENEQEILQRISHPQKRLEWLSSRLCLKELLKIRHPVESLNETTGKPYLSDHSFHISYSHSNLYSGAIASAEQSVSIDLEDLSKKRNPDTSRLFMHPTELEHFRSTGDLRVFFLTWSAKETLYKIYAKKGIAFRDNLLVNPERLPVQPSGTVSGIIKIDEYEKYYTIHYRFFPGVLLTYTFGNGVPVRA